MPNVISPSSDIAQLRFAIIVARWNETITRKLLDGAVAKLKEQGVADGSIDVVWVPGSMELPLVAKRLAVSNHYAAVICLGVVIRGETTHDHHINRAVSTAITQIALDTNIPALFGVLTCETMDQAVQRAGGNVGNKGAECAEAAIQMAALLKTLP